MAYVFINIFFKGCELDYNNGTDSFKRSSQLVVLYNIYS